jgi:signal transduction histidine kinase
MYANNGINKLVTEEIKATKLFLWLFYIVFISYDVMYYFIIPLVTKNREVGLPESGMGYWFYILVLGILPLSIYFMKSSKPYIVKYLIFIIFTIIDLLNTLPMYIGTDHEYASGNLVEILFVLYTPLFINKSYFWFATWGTIFKYGFFGLVLQDPKVILAIVILVVLAGIAYVFLYRFYSYIRSLEKVNEDLRNNEKLAVVGQLATSIGHEIRNPLAALKGFTQLQYEKYPNDKEFYQIMKNEIERINLIVNDLMYLGKPKSLILVKQDIKGIIEYVVMILNQIAQSNNVHVKINLDNVPEINCDENQLKQVFINLVKNAIESMPAGGNIIISYKVIDSNQVVIFIEDEGLGIDENKLSRLGQPFFTTKEDGNGLGLLVTFNIIDKHKGKIVYNSVIGKGTTVATYLPIS